MHLQNGKQTLLKTQRHQKEAHKRYQNLSEKEKGKRQKCVKKDIKILLKKKKKKGIIII